MEKTFADLVRDRIETAYGGRQVDFARATGFKPQTVNTWLKGRVTLPQIDARRRLAKELGMTHVELLVSMGELDASEVSIPTDPRSPAVRRLQPLIEEIRWNPRLFRWVEDSLVMVRDLQGAAVKPLLTTDEMEGTAGIGITEFGEGDEIVRRQHRRDQEETGE